MIELDCKLTPAPEMVILRELEETTVSTGGFFLSEGSFSNSRMGFFLVEAVGEVAKEETSLKPGDYVFADRLASHYHTSPVCVMRWNNVLLITDERRSRLDTLPGWALIKETDDDSSDADSPKFLVTGTNNAKIRHGVVRSINWGSSEHKPFAVGDDVMITSQCDVYDGLSDGRLIAMKITEIVARIDK